MSTTDIFPFLNLPYLAIEKTLHKISLIDLIDFTLCSSKCKKIVQSSPTLQSSVNEINVSVENFSRSIDLTSSVDEELSVTWDFSKPYRRQRPTSNRCINGQKMKIHRNHLSVQIHEKEQWVVCMGNIIEYLSEIFKKAPISMRLSFDDVNFPIQNAQVILTKPCENLVLYSGDITPTNDQMHFILSNLKVSKKFEFNISPERDFQYQQPFEFHVDHLKLHLDFWMTRAIFLSLLNCSTVYINHSFMNSEDYLELITHWFNSRQTRFHYMEVEVCRVAWMTFDLSRFDGKPWDSKRRPRYFKKSGETEEIDVSDGIDIERSDGLIATILQKPPTLERSSMFQFVVWHN